MVRLLLQLNSNQINWFDSTLTPAQGGLGIPDLTTEAPQQYSASKFFKFLQLPKRKHLSFALPRKKCTFSCLSEPSRRMSIVLGTFTCSAFRIIDR